MIIYVEQNVIFKSKVLNFKKTGTEKRKLKKKNKKTDHKRFSSF